MGSAVLLIPCAWKTNTIGHCSYAVSLPAYTCYQCRVTCMADGLDSQDTCLIETRVMQNVSAQKNVSFTQRTFSILTFCVSCAPMDMEINSHRITKSASNLENAPKAAPDAVLTAPPPVYEASEMGANIDNDISDMQRLGKKQEFKVPFLENAVIRVPKVDVRSGNSGSFLPWGSYRFSWPHGSLCLC